MSDTAAQPESADAPPKKKKWGFLTAFAVVLLLMVVGEFVSRLGDGIVRNVITKGEFPGLRGWLVWAFWFFALAWAWLSRASVIPFLRSMHAGVSVVVMTTVAVTAGVLVPQIDGFEDPDQRVTPANYEMQYEAFAWAEGYFLYHLMHLYGIGMPEAEIPAPAQDGLERYSLRYGHEAGQNAEKRMRAALGGQAKSAEITAFIRSNDASFRQAFDICTALHLNRAYKSGWFKTLLLVLFASILSNTFTGKPASWISVRRIGFFTTHLGMLTMLIGGLVSNTFTKRGILHLDLEHLPSDEFNLWYERDRKAKMPFTLGLERFARKDWLQVQVFFPNSGLTSRPPTETLWPGRVLEMDYAEVEGGGPPVSRLKIECLDVSDHASIGNPVLSETPEGDLASGEGPMAQFRMSGQFSDGEVYDEIVTRVPEYEGMRHIPDPNWSFRLTTRYGADAKEVQTEFPADDGLLGYLHARLSGSSDAQSVRLPVRLGEEVIAPGGYRILVERAMPSFRFDPSTNTERIDPRPIAVQYPRNPAVALRITPENGLDAEERLVFEYIDAVSNGMQSGYKHHDLILSLEWDEWSSPGPPRYALIWGTDSGAQLVPERGTEMPVALGERLDLPGSTNVELAKLFNNAKIDQEITFKEFPAEVPGQVDLGFYSQEPRGARLRITRFTGTDREVVDELNMATSESQSPANVWRSPDGEVIVSIFENTAMMPFEWRSVLSVWDQDESGGLTKVDVGPERSREIRVNDYFYHRGYRFFQTNADPRFPTYSGIGVVYDPGIPIVLIGMYTIILGTVLAFIVRPIVLARKKRSAAA